MKIYNTKHNGIHYSFEFLEESGIIYIVKGGELAYDMFVTSKAVVCTCPGFKYRHKCWHTGQLSQIKSAHSVRQPWAEWAEVAGLMRREQLKVL